MCVGRGEGGVERPKFYYIDPTLRNNVNVAQRTPHDICFNNHGSHTTTGRGMNAAFAIGRLCDMEQGRRRLLGLADSEKMVDLIFAKILKRIIASFFFDSSIKKISCCKVHETFIFTVITYIQKILCTVSVYINIYIF